MLKYKIVFFALLSSCGLSLMAFQDFFIRKPILWLPLIPIEDLSFQLMYGILFGVVGTLDFIAALIIMCTLWDKEAEHKELTQSNAKMEAGAK